MTTTTSAADAPLLLSVKEVRVKLGGLSDTTVRASFVERRSDSNRGPLPTGKPGGVLSGRTGGSGGLTEFRRRPA